MTAFVIARTGLDDRTLVRDAMVDVAARHVLADVYEERGVIDIASLLRCPIYGELVVPGLDRDDCIRLWCDELPTREGTHKRVDKMTTAEEARMVGHTKKWIDIGLSTERVLPCDEPHCLRELGHDPPHNVEAARDGHPDVRAASARPRQGPCRQARARSMRIRMVCGECGSTLRLDVAECDAWLRRVACYAYGDRVTDPRAHAIRTAAILNEWSPARLRLGKTTVIMTCRPCAAPLVLDGDPEDLCTQT